MKTFSIVLSILLLALLHPAVQAQDVTATIIVWNVASGDADPNVVANPMASKGEIALWGLSEVQNQQWLALFEATLERATGEPRTALLDSTGNADRLAILYRDNVFDALGGLFEIDEVQIGSSGLRPALGIRLKGQQTAQEFFLVVHDFKASGGAQKHYQAYSANAGNECLGA